MSVEDTLAERGARYGDFTDHAEICQALMRVMQRAKNRNSWPDLSDVQRQSLTVIADKIARILSGDPDYADNWHDIQGYAKLVEDRLPKAPSAAMFDSASLGDDCTVRSFLFTPAPSPSPSPTPPGEDIYAEFAARLGAAPTIVLPATPTACPECGYPTDAAGTHYATCSQLTAPEEYKAEAQVAFDEAAELSEALARQVSAGKIPDPAYSHCPHCGSPKGYLHNPDCNTMRRGKSRLAQGATKFLGATAEVIAVDESAEPAAAMDDDSPRMQAIGQNGNEGEHYDDPFAGAPEWAKYKAQDADGEWFHYSHEPVPKDVGVWARSDVLGNDCEFHMPDVPNPNWRDTLITRT